MFILRHTFTVKEGRLEEAKEHFRWWLNRFSPRGSRIYTPTKDTSPTVLVFDEEFESMAEFESFWSKLQDDPDFGPARKKNHELADGQSEFWRVIESV